MGLTLHLNISRTGHSFPHTDFQDKSTSIKCVNWNVDMVENEKMYFEMLHLTNLSHPGFCTITTANLMMFQLFADVWQFLNRWTLEKHNERHWYHRRGQRWHVVSLTYSNTHFICSHGCGGLMYIQQPTCYLKNMTGYGSLLHQMWNDIAHGIMILNIEFRFLQC